MNSLDVVREGSALLQKMAFEPNPASFEGYMEGKFSPSTYKEPFMNESLLSDKLETALLAVVPHVAEASNRLAEVQKKPETDAKTLSAHVRVLAGQISALRTLSTLRTRLQPAQPHATTGEKCAAEPRWEAAARAAERDLAALQKRIPECAKKREEGLRVSAPSPVRAEPMAGVNLLRGASLLR